MEAIRSLRHNRGQHSHAAVRMAILLLNGSVFIADGPPQVTPNRMLREALKDLLVLAARYRLPDVAFVLNVDDYPYSLFDEKARGRPPPPLFSHYQTRRHADIVVPSGRFRMDEYDRTLLLGSSWYEREHPWSEKQSVAFWRGTPYCGAQRFSCCSRYVLSHVSAQPASTRAHLEGDRRRRHNTHLDVALVRYDEAIDPYRRRGHWHRCSQCASPQACEPHSLLSSEVAGAMTSQRRVPLRAHSRFRYLLHLDGNSASSRLQSLLAINSLVMKQVRTLCTERASVTHIPGFLLAYTHSPRIE